MAASNNDDESLCAAGHGVGEGEMREEASN